MSHPATSPEAKPASSPTRPLDPQIGLMFTAADHLIPLFRTGSIDVALAREMAISAIEAYHPETRADFVNAARTIAFSMAALTLLGLAASRDMPMPEKMRAYSRANALNRSADQSERTMMQRRRYHHANPPDHQPDPETEAPADDAPIDEAEMQAAVAVAMNEYLAICPPKKSAATEPHAATAQPQAGSPASAIRYTGATPDAAPPQRDTQETGLPRQTAMPHLMEQTGRSHTGQPRPS